MLYEQQLQDIPLSFSGHESFSLRYAWLPKVIQALHQHPNLFERDDDLVILGVGKNMVRSMRHWCIAMQLIELPQRGALDAPTQLGKSLFAEDGWDPYLEDPGTLWLLHWLLASRPEKASTWFLTFSQFTPDSGEGFTRTELVEWLNRKLSDRPTVRATINSLKRDVDVFIRTYVPSPVKATHPPEDSFDSPLAELGILKEVKRDTFTFDEGSKAALPDLIFLYALLEYWNNMMSHQETLSFDQIAHGLGSPGAVFKLRENKLAERLERLPSWSGITFDETAGMRQLLRTGELLEPLSILKSHYAAGDAYQ